MKKEIVLVTVRGDDAPGITAKLGGILAGSKGVWIEDIEQTVTHGKLMLSILLAFRKGRYEKSSVLKELLFAARELGVQLEFEAFDQKRVPPIEESYRYAITCLGKEVGAEPLTRIAEALATHDVNIDRISKMSRKGMACVELITHAVGKIDHMKLARNLLALASDLDVDVAVQPADLSRRTKRLVVMDMDSTLLAGEAIDELARAHGKLNEVKKITALSMEGRINFERSLRKRVRLLEGLTEKAVMATVKRMRLTSGAARFIAVLHQLGFRTAVVSGGFEPFADYLKARLGLNYAFANRFEVKDGRLTGRVTGDVVDGRAKARILEWIAKNENIPLSQVVAIGDGANDMLMLSRAGMGIAFHAKEKVKRAAHTTIGYHAGLDSILYLLGIREEEIRHI